MGIESVLGDSLSWGTATTILSERDATDIFSILASEDTKLEELSNTFLDAGITQYTNGDYEEAARSFAAAIAIYPDSDNNADTVKYLAQTYIELDEVDKAIETYETAIANDPTNADFRTALGQLYYSEERYDEAVAQYRKAVDIDDSSENRYSYGEALLKIEDYEEAEYQFEQVVKADPDSTAGYYGLGKTYSLMEEYDEAIKYFQEALEIDDEFYDAMAEIGYAYCDLGDFDAARDVLEELEDLDEDLADTLEEYIDQTENPEIDFAYASSTFPYQATSGYLLSNIDSYLENAGAELSMTMTFQFTKSMDASSVESIYNWSITRAESDNIAETYNYGDEIPSTEITLNYYPDYVLYDSDTGTATLGFTIRQNETADGTIDPSHIVFSFNGEDIYGVSMSEDGDEYSGFSGSA
ncbi:tetratricopeptide repeat protein [uncultured Desulfosarcina sp.]|uniref:tetratricopeptide repeat protein n=1 Tax=uncultured Desulfosarcina sp. TaxID=218289 RepID=UPI0029C88A88|nr:tetratricopeptide repeat protein [uncultured Desulfosarcina sp.]